MKAYYNGITLEGTPKEVAQCIKAIQEQDKQTPYKHPHMPNVLVTGTYPLISTTTTSTSDNNSVEQQKKYGRVYTGDSSQSARWLTSEAMMAQMKSWANDPE